MIKSHSGKNNHIPGRPMWNHQASRLCIIIYNRSFVLLNLSGTNAEAVCMLQ